MNIRKLAVVVACVFSTTMISFAQVLDQIIVVVGDDMIKQSDVENQQLLLEQQGEKSDKCNIFREMVMQ